MSSTTVTTQALPVTGNKRDFSDIRAQAKTENPPFYILPDTLRIWPWQYTISPFYKECQADSVAWLESFTPFSARGQIAFNKCDFSLVSALCFPKGSKYDLRSCCDLMHTFFTLDEYTDPLPKEEVIVLCEATMHAILHPDKPRPEGENKIGEITRQFWKRASAYAPKATIERFERSWRSYLDSVITQAERRDDRYICDIEEYMESRRDNIGSDPSFAFLEMSLQIDIPHEIMQHPFIVAMQRDTTDMIVLANDMCSFKKEILDDDADYNAVTVVMSNTNCTVQEGIDWISKRHDDVVDNFLRIREDVLNQRNGFPSYGEDLDRQIALYVDGLGQWIRGHDDWNFGSGRYFGEEGDQVKQHRKVIIAPSSSPLKPAHATD